MTFIEWERTQEYIPNPSNADWYEYAKKAWNGALEEALNIVIRDVVSDWRGVDELRELTIDVPICDGEKYITKKEEIENIKLSCNRRVIQAQLEFLELAEEYEGGKCELYDLIIKKFGLK